MSDKQERERQTPAAGEITCITSTESNATNDWPKSGASVLVKLAGARTFPPGSFEPEQLPSQRGSPSCASGLRQRESFR
jgi:hypothetical protein